MTTTTTTTVAAAFAAVSRMDEDTKRMRAHVAGGAPRQAAASSSSSPSPPSHDEQGTLCLVLGEMYRQGPSSIVVDTRRATLLVEHTSFSLSGHTAAAVALVKELAEQKRRVGAAVTEHVLQMVCAIVRSEFDIQRLIASGMLMKPAFASTCAWDAFASAAVDDTVGALRVTKPPVDPRLLERITTLAAATTALPGGLKYVVAAMLCELDPYVHLHVDGVSLVTIPFEADGFVCFLPIDVHWMEHFECCVLGGRVQEYGDGGGAMLAPLVAFGKSTTVIDPIAQFYLHRTLCRTPSAYVQRNTYTARMDTLDAKRATALASSDAASLTEVLVHVLLTTDLDDMATATQVLTRRKRVGCRMWHPFLRVSVDDPFTRPQRANTHSPSPSSTVLAMLHDASTSPDTLPRRDPTVPLRKPAKKRRKIH